MSAMKFGAEKEAHEEKEPREEEPHEETNPHKKPWGREEYHCKIP